MFRGQPLCVAFCLSLLVLAGFAYVSTAASPEGRDPLMALVQAPTVVLDASSTTVSVCPRDASRAVDARVQLVARATDPRGEALHYNWSASGGRIDGDGPNTNWDLTGAQPGVYTAQVEVSRGRERDCMA